MNTRSVINIRYAQIRSLDVSNGEGVGCALFVQGCHFRCPGCFNSETWDFNGGKEWTDEVQEEFLKLIDRPYIKRISILGGSPLANENLDGVLKLVNQIRLLLPNKSIWLYTGYTVNIFELPNSDHTEIELIPRNNNECDLMRAEVIRNCNVVVDGRFEEDKKDLTLRFKGSTNQRLIDVEKTLKKGEIVLWDSIK